MAKLILPLLLTIVMCTSGFAQKPVLAANYKPTPDTTAIKPLLAAVAPNKVHAEKKVRDVARRDREILEETAQLRLQGRQDAKQYYKVKGVFWGTMGTTILYPAAGLATGTIVAVVPPSTTSAANPNANLMKEPAYEEAFKKQAHRKRFGNAAAGFGVGVAVLGIVSKVLVGRL